MKKKKKSEKNMYDKINQMWVEDEEDENNEVWLTETNIGLFSYIVRIYRR